MPNLKDIRDRKKSVLATQKITAAMKLVAGAKLRRFQAQREIVDRTKGRLETILRRCLCHLETLDEIPPLAQSSPNETGTRHLVVVFSSDRGLCGNFNQQLLRAVQAFYRKHVNQGQHLAFYCVGRKGYEGLKRFSKLNVVGEEMEIGHGFHAAQRLFQQILVLRRTQSVGRVTLAYNAFRNVMLQTPRFEPFLPLSLEPYPDQDQTGKGGLYMYEPGIDQLLETTLPYFFSFKLYQILVESYVSEQGARMTAMDGATHNAQDMIKRLELTYNRTRQAYITNELIEIISGAEAI